MEIRTGLLLGSFALSLSALATPALADGGQTGIASYYWQGTKTASGERYNPGALTAAHRSLPFNTKVRVTNLRNGRSVLVRINDRGPFIRGRVIDVSRAAANELGFAAHGLTKVKIQVVEAGGAVAQRQDRPQDRPAAASSTRSAKNDGDASAGEQPVSTPGSTVALNWRVPTVEEPAY